jgi:hypothetical protein
VLESVFQSVFPLLVSSKLGLYIYMLQLEGSITRVIGVCGYFCHCYVSQNLYNKMCEVG